VKADAGKARKTRRPAVRALKAAAALQVPAAAETSVADSSSTADSNVVQRSVPESTQVTMEAASATFVALES
jgi:hypothetical protein